jgi:hypothetical protein
MDPHIMAVYSTARQPAEPIIRALGGSLPERQVQLNEVSVVNHGALSATGIGISKPPSGPAPRAADLGH